MGVSNYDAANVVVKTGEGVD